MSAGLVSPPQFDAVQLDSALEQLLRRREQSERAEPGPDRSMQIARLYDIEARLWSVTFESTGVRLYWRAALAAEAHARGQAERWRRQAATEASAIATSPVDAADLVITGGAA